MNIFNNLDLLAVGVAIAATGILGAVVIFNDRRSATNQAFLLFSFSTMGWGIVNYLQYQTETITLSFWLLRFVLFFAISQAFSLFYLFYVFPAKDFILPKWLRFGLIPLTLITMTATLTPLVFARVVAVEASRIVQIENGVGMILFGAVSVGLVLGALFFLIKKIIFTARKNRNPLVLMLVGTILMFFLIITFNFIFPAFLNDPRFIPLGAVFILPFVFFASYALIKHNFLGIKVVNR